MRGPRVTRGTGKRDDPALGVDGLDRSLADLGAETADGLRRPFSFVIKREDYHAQPWEFVLGKPDILGDFTVYLPVPADADANRTKIAVRNDSTSGIVTVKALRSTINGQASVTLSAGQSSEFISDGDEWKTSGGIGPQGPAGAAGASGAQGAQGPSGTGWTTIYERFFGDLSNQDLKSGGDGDKTIDGVVWRFDNTANLTSCDVIAGTGIKFVASATNTQHNGGTNNAPVIGSRFQRFFSDFSPSRHVMRISMRVTTTGQDALTEEVQMGITHEGVGGAIGVNTFAGNHKTFITGALNYRASITAGGVSAVRLTTTANVSDDVLVMVMVMPSCYDFYTSTYASGIPAEPEHFRYAEHIDGDEIISTPSAAWFYFAFATGNTAAAFTATITHIRVEVYDRYPTT